MTLLAVGIAACLNAQAAGPGDETLDEGGRQRGGLPLKTVPVTIRDRSFFTDRIATAVVNFDTVVEPPESMDRASDTCRIIQIEVLETPDSKQGKSSAIVHFLPRQPGVATLPSLDFRSQTAAYQTEPRQIRVGEPIRSDALSLSWHPVKRQVYVGEPLRVVLTWECQLDAARLRDLRLNPEFFTDPNIQVVIPRNTDREDLQVGLPIGGRRVIATRHPSTNEKRNLGTITLPLYLRFAEPGRYTLSETRLECAVLSQASKDFGRYAAHFNNGLFEAVDPTLAYERVYTTAPAMEIDVLPLPGEQQDAPFSGLFAPLGVEVSVTPTEVKIGELMELEVKLSGEAPHGMLELPKLSRQPGLRERFLVDDHTSRRWHQEGTLFRTRLRALSTSVQAFPSLELQIFDPETGRFTLTRTEPIPLRVRPSQGRDYLSRKSFEGAAVSLTNQPEGIWHNLEPNSMDDLLNTLDNLIRQAFWPLLLLGPVGFVVLLPVVRELRRRALDARYRLRADAYREFRKRSGNSREKWAAFLRFMSLTFQAGDNTWTRRDSETALQKIGVDDNKIATIVAMHNAADAQDFSEQNPQARFKNLNEIAKHIAHRAAKMMLVILFVAVSMPIAAQADEWSEAEQRFAQAQAAAAGSDDAHALYQDAALKFQAAATSRQRPGKAWYNAGNAWFQAGALGRAIAAYRQAELDRPFDPKIEANLAAARAMALNDVPDTEPWWRRIPAAWLKAMAVIVNLVFWALLLLTLRYRHRSWGIVSAVCALVLCLIFALLIQKSWTEKQAGTVVVGSVFGKKGPGYAYANAFNQPLHDGLEFILIERRGDWGRIELPDTRQCWVPTSQIQLIVE